GMQDQAAERGLDMAGRTAEPVVQIEVAKRRLDIVAPQQADDAAAEPDAFRIAGRSVHGLLDLGILLDLLGRRRSRCRRCRRLFGALGIAAALGGGRTGCARGCGCKPDCGAEPDRDAENGFEVGSRFERHLVSWGYCLGDTVLEILSWRYCLGDTVLEI